MIIISYTRCVQRTGYKIRDFIKCLKGSRATRARISNINIRKKRREHCYRKLEKRERREERLYFSKPKKQIGSNKMLRKIDSRTAFSPQICQIWVLGTPVICLIHQSEALTVLYLYVH